MISLAKPLVAFYGKKAVDKIELDLQYKPEALFKRTADLKSGEAMDYFTLKIGMKDKQDLLRDGGGLAGGDMIVTLRHDVWRGLWRGVRDRFTGRG